MIGQTLAHFRILSKIGEGGMGVVYRAEDQILRRAVALKVLPPELVGDEERRLRFLREARAAAAVTHPNIATIYEVGEEPAEAGQSQGVVFIAMQLVEGRTLRQAVGGRALPLKEAIRIATEVAEGLAAAHASGVVHRDLKPENVLLGADGHVRIVDFGLARLLQEPGTADEASSRLRTLSGEMTRAGKILGTAAYMSPEQARGEIVDVRTDLFSFGILLYEMTTGRVPFQGKTVTDTLSAILRDQPAPVSQVNPEAPAELDRIISECLEKDPAERYQHADQLAVDLRRLKRSSDTEMQSVRTPGAQSGAERVPSEAPASGRQRWLGPTFRWWGVAAAVMLLTAAATGVVWLRRAPGSFRQGDKVLVADFENHTGQSQFESSVRDAFEDLLVPSRFVDIVRGERRRKLLGAPGQGSAGRVDRVTAERLCREGKLEGFVTGAVAGDGGRYTLEAGLYRTGSTGLAWSCSETVASESDVLPAIHRMTLELRRAMGDSAQALATSFAPTTRSLAAYQLFAMAGRLGEDKVYSDLERIALYKQAIDLDPQFAEAYSRASTCSWDLGEFQQWREMIRSAFEHSRGLPEGERLPFEIDWLDASFDYDREVEQLKVYARLFPNDALGPNYLFTLYSSIMDEDDATSASYAREAYQRDPDPVSFLNLSLCLANQGSVEESRRLIAEFRSRGGDERGALLGEAWTQRTTGDWKAVRETAERLAQVPGAWASDVSYLRLAATLMAGRLAEAKPLASDLWRDAVRDHVHDWLFDSGLVRAWLLGRREGRAPPLPEEVLKMAEGDLGHVRALTNASVELGLPGPIEGVLGLPHLAASARQSHFAREEVDFARGSLALLRGRATEARKILEPLAADSHLRSRHQVLARTYEVLGLWREAASEYEFLLRNPAKKWLNTATGIPTGILHEYRLARACDRLGDVARARTWYERFLVDWKDADPDIQEVLQARARLAALAGPAGTPAQ
jgi:eukaryotic-like serine/threonine-protein kinase